METNFFLQAANTKRLIIDDLPVTYFESGSGEAMVLLHGWPQTSYIWRKVWQDLATRYHVYAINLPGMGNTDASPNADTRSVAMILKAFCDRLGLNKFHLVAHDVGAWVAVTFALEYEPVISSLVILDAGIPGLMPDEVFSPQNAQKIWQFYFHAIDGMPEYLIEGKEKEYLNWYFSRKVAVKNAITAEDISIYTQAYTGKERLANGFAFYRAFTESSMQNKSYQRKLKIPVLTMGGEQAQGLSMGKALEKVTDNPVEAVSIQNCGHYIVEEQPEIFLKLLFDFLK